MLGATPAAAPLARLLALFDGAIARGISPEHLSADLGEVRGFAYYTGTIFHIYAAGPGEAVGAGGRYDELLACFGAPMAAMGFAFDLDSLEWALRSAGVATAAGARIVVVGGGETRAWPACASRGSLRSLPRIAPPPSSGRAGGAFRTSSTAPRWSM